MLKRLSIVLLLLASPAFADDGLSDSEILARLGDDRYAVREAISDQLLCDVEIAAARIDRLYAAADSLEQRHRLLRIARHHLLRNVRNEQYPGGQQGSLGVSIKEVEQSQLPEVGQASIYVARTYPGFPAFEKLRVGDLILSIEGQKPANQTGIEIVKFLQNKIIEHQAGELVKLVVRREGENFEMQIMLANMDALKGMYDSRTIQEIALNNPMGQQMAIIASDLTTLPLMAEYEKLWRQRRAELEAAVPTR